RNEDRTNTERTRRRNTQARTEVALAGDWNSAKFLLARRGEIATINGHYADRLPFYRSDVDRARELRLSLHQGGRGSDRAPHGNQQQGPGLSKGPDPGQGSDRRAQEAAGPGAGRAVEGGAHRPGHHRAGRQPQESPR